MFLAFGYSVLITRPLQRVTESIDDIAAGDMDTKLDVHTYSEVERISESFNRMIDVIRQQDEAKQSFASNVSHELKTPLASMKVLSDSLLSQEGMPEELYREFLVDITHEIERMTNIINDLLTMVKLDKNTAEMNIVNISINDLIEQLLKRLRPIAAERNIELIYESFRPIIADGDEVKLSIALNNLIENAIKYNYDDGWVRVTLNADHKFLRVDSDVIDKLIPKNETKETDWSEAEQEEMKDVFNAQLPKEGGMYVVNFEALGETADPVLITRSEFMRRMKEMAAMNPGMGFYGAMDDQFTLVVNTDHKLVKNILADEQKEMAAKLEPIDFEIKENEGKKTEIDELNKGKKEDEIPQVDKDRKKEYDDKINGLRKQKQELLQEYGKGNQVVGQLIDLALLANGLLKGEALNKFVKRSVELIK